MLRCESVSETALDELLAAPAGCSEGQSALNPLSARLRRDEPGGSRVLVGYGHRGDRPDARSRPASLPRTRLEAQRKTRGVLADTLALVGSTTSAPDRTPDPQPSPVEIRLAQEDAIRVVKWLGFLRELIEKLDTSFGMPNCRFGSIRGRGKVVENVHSISLSADCLRRG